MQCNLKTMPYIYIYAPKRNFEILSPRLAREMPPVGDSPESFVFIVVRRQFGGKIPAACDY